MPNHADERTHGSFECRPQTSFKLTHYPRISAAAAARSAEYILKNVAEADRLIGKSVTHYSIIEKLGEGGMGVVYLARDTHLDRFVAIKLLPPDKTADPER